MKDYYYILGVARTASPEEIRQAYRKLSLKFHPDKNEGDKFFEDRFKEINEAYEILSNPVRRFNYDESFAKKSTYQQSTSSSTQTPPRSDPPKPPDMNFWKRNSSTQTPPRSDSPRIISFTADKAAIGIGDTVTFRWQVENATSVELRPFGTVTVSGEKTIKINGFNSPEGLYILLIVQNQSTSLIEKLESKILIYKKDKISDLDGDGKQSQSQSIKEPFSWPNAPSQKSTRQSKSNEKSDTWPEIILFKADKSWVNIGDLVTFEWIVRNVNVVELQPFGKVDLIGSKTIKVTELNELDSLIVALRATGEIVIKKTIKLHVYQPRIVDQDERDFSIKSNIIQEQKIKNNAPPIVEEIKDRHPPVQPNKEEKATKSWWDREWIYPLIGFVGLFMYNHYYKSDSNLQKQATGIVNEQTAVDSSTLLHNNDKKSDVEMPAISREKKPQISQYNGNQLRNGDSPFSSCFGKGKRGSHSWILFQNQNGVDAVVCLINSISGATIRNEYIKAGDSFEMSNVPVGIYYVKVLYGNDWNPTLVSPCGSSGFFESDVNFSVSDGYNDQINVETSDDGYSIRYSTHTVTLYPVANGNMSQRGIDAGQFFGR